VPQGNTSGTQAWGGGLAWLGYRWFLCRHGRSLTNGCGDFRIPARLACAQVWSKSVWPWLVAASGDIDRGGWAGENITAEIHCDRLPRVLLGGETSPNARAVFLQPGDIFKPMRC
jgi:hypothetical protein